MNGLPRCLSLHVAMIVKSMAVRSQCVFQWPIEHPMGSSSISGPQEVGALLAASDRVGMVARTWHTGVNSLDTILEVCSLANNIGLYVRAG